MKEDDDTLHSVEIRKVDNGYVIRITTEIEEKELVFHKQIHVLKYLKELFKE